ncbi:hypothetical protein LCGC14_2484420 [marine sediment metagenome]|uniref:Uncharacterized protein n=1 Tax=marine sediment metagenome TaxID=412755 RepID=A0A0F9E0A9_9ZZZZ
MNNNENGINAVYQEERKQEIKIGRGVYKVGKLSYIQMLDIAMFYAEVALKLGKEVQNIKTDGADIMQDSLAIFSKLDNNDKAKFMGILIEETDIEFCKKIGSEEALDVLLAISENNNLESISKKVQRLLSQKTKSQ